MPSVLSVPLWLLPNVLSLDAPAVALLWQAFLAGVFHVPLPAAARVSLGLAVWAIYIADRLLDTRRAGSGMDTARHRFHKQHRRAMSWLLLAAVLCASGTAVFQVRPAVFRAGIVLAAAVGLYLYAVHRRYLPNCKEFAVAVLFSAGTALAPVARSPRKEAILIAGALFFLVCLANTTAIEAVESPRTPQHWPVGGRLRCAERWRRRGLESGTPIPQCSASPWLRNVPLWRCWDCIGGGEASRAKPSGCWRTWHC